MASIVLCHVRGSFVCLLFAHFVYICLLSFRGQTMNAEMIANIVDVELVYEGIKYTTSVSVWV